MTENVAPVTVQTRKPIVIAPPLDGPNWLDGNSCCDMTAHRMALNPINGETVGRRTIRDRLRPTEPRRHGCSPATRPTSESYPYFGADILAVGDGPVVATLDGLPEQVPGTAPDRPAARAVRRQPHRPGHRRRQLRALRPPQDRRRQGQARRPADRRAGDRLNLGNSGNTDAPASALPRHEHARPAAFRRAAVRVPLVPAGLAVGRVAAGTRSTCSRANPRSWHPGSRRVTKTTPAHSFST